jgi:pilus assembly protein FimV
MMVFSFSASNSEGGSLRKITCKSVLRTVLIAGACLFSVSSLAAGLGKLTVLSSLGQPLQAEIEIVSLQPGEVDSISAKLASAEAFRQANIELNGALLGVKFAIERRAGNQYVLTLTSTQPMNEPFIDALVELSWVGGRLVREYTFLLDPPEYKGPAVAAAPVVAAPAAPAAAPAPAASAPVEPARPAAAAPAATARPAEAASPSRSAPSTYEVKRGDTLAKIAQQNRIEGISLQQMLAALYRGNRDAFDGENMNRLRSGRILNLPDKDTASAISPSDAVALVNTQGADYATYRRSLGASVAESSGSAGGGRQAAGKIGAPEAPAPKAAEASKDQLRLSRAEDGKAGGRAARAAAQDDAAAKARALAEANDRIAQLEKNLADMQKLAQLKSQSGAQLQQQAQKADAPKADAAKSPAPEAAKAASKAPDAPASKAAEPAKAAEAPKAPEAAKAAEAPKAAEAAKAADLSKAPAPDAAKVAEAPKAAPKAAPKPVAPPPPPPDMLDELTGNPLMMGGAGGVVILLAGYAFYAVRRRRKQAAANSAASLAASDTNSVLASSSLEVDTASSQLQEEVGEEQPAKAESEEIDPIAEADVYMAYGRDPQAEEILKEALAKDTSRQPVRLKLLEIYANRKDAASFAAEAGHVQVATGGQGPDWEKVAALGASIDPANPLYGSGATEVVDLGSDDTQVLNVGELEAPPAAAEEAPASELDFDLGAATDGQPDINLGEEAPAAEEVAAPVAEEAAAPTTLDFDLDLGSGDTAAAADVAQAPAEPAAEVAAADGGLSIDFDLPSSDAPAPQEAAPATEAALAAEDGGLSIDFDLGPTAAESAAPAAEPALDLSSISLDLGSDQPQAEGAAPDEHWQEVATKLDLAKAYQEMGDKDGARELLNEVLKEGDAAQQQQATTMLEALG